MPPQQPQENAEGSMDVLWGAVMAVVIIGIIWLAGKEHIVRGLCWLRMWELRAFTWALPSAQAVFQSLAHHRAHAQSVSLTQFANLLGASGSYWAYPLAAVCGLSGLYLIFGHTKTRFKTIHSMDSLFKLEVPVWKLIAPVSQLNLIEQPIDEGPWAMSLTPIQFAKQHQLLTEHTESGHSFSAEPTIRIELDKRKAHRAFVQQLGPVWQSPTALPVHVRALFAVFAARAERDTQSAVELLEHIAMSSLQPSDSLDFSGTDALLQKHIQSKRVANVCRQHAYTLPVMASMLELARTDGVLATSDFIWLRPLDRPLWYMLNTVGRQTAFPEVAGPFAHWIIEKRMKRSMMTPMVDKAVVALDVALQEIIYTPEPAAADAPPEPDTHT